ncbi:putative ribonuclease H protein [Nymphaea thermarum]|nr:putative ribonuclease H protein [Nymphaea thermarum]
MVTWVGACPSLLTFADDLIIFSRGEHRSYNEVMHALEALKLSSGLSVNPHKSHAIFFGKQRTPLSFISNSDCFQGRLCLIKYVILSLIGYWCSVFMLPNSIQHKLEATMTNFLWGSQETWKGVHLVAWKTLCHPILEGGVGLNALADWNKGVLPPGGERETEEVSERGRGLWLQEEAPWGSFPP